MTFGQAVWGTDESTSRAIFDEFASAGGNFIDTAHIYGGGASERFLSDLIKIDRHHFVIATKYTPSLAPGVAKAGNSRKAMMQMVDESLARLGTEFIDLFYVHMWDGTAPVDEVMRGLDDLVAMGKVLYVGCSNMPAWQVSRANTLADLRGWSRFVGLQVEYSLAQRDAERELLPMAAEIGIGVTAWSPLGGGALVAPTGKRVTVRRTSKESQALADLIAEIAHQSSSPPVQVALAAIRQQPWQIIPVIGASSAEQIRQALGCTDFVLEAAQLERLNQASRVQLGYPHDFLAQDSVRAIMTGGSPSTLDMPRNRHNP